MAIKIVKNKYYVFKGEKSSEPKFRKEISQRIISQFGKGPYDHNVIKEILIYGLTYYTESFKQICHKETSYTFYKMIFWLHEQATELANLYPHENLSAEITREYIAKYRRIQKYILEVGCNVKMKTGEKMNSHFKKRLEPILNDLLYLGTQIFDFAESLAEQEIIEDVTDISFTKENMYKLSRRHHYEIVFKHMRQEVSTHLNDSLIDQNGHKDFYDALDSCFGIKYEDVCSLIRNLHKHFKVKPGEPICVNWESLPNNLSGSYGIIQENAEIFFMGLRLDANNKMSLWNLARKPHSLCRFLYKPILIWSIDDKDWAILGAHSWDESIHQYITNAFPWGKAPSEWMTNTCFEKFVHNKEDEHDKWLDNAVEEKLIKQKLLYDKNVKHLKTLKGDISINKSGGIGEIDFIIIDENLNKIFIADCKHLLGRYDISNQRNDYFKFTDPKDKKAYNTTMSNKLTWLNANKSLIEQHFVKKYKDINISFKSLSIEGIFIINTPTIYMYSSEYRIYTISQIEDVLSGAFKDPTFTYLIVEEDSEKTIFSKYPFFKKPKYVMYIDSEGDSSS